MARELELVELGQPEPAHTAMIRSSAAQAEASDIEPLIGPLPEGERDEMFACDLDEAIRLGRHR